MGFDIVLIILAGWFLRLYRIQDFYMFLADQGRDALIVKKIVTLHNFPAIGPPSSIGEVFLGPFYYYLVAPFLFLTRLNPVGLALGVAILSGIGVFVTYSIVRKTISPQVAFIFLLFTTFSYELVRVARFSWNPNLLPYFSFITMYFFAHAMDDKNKKRTLDALCFGLFFGLSFQLHHLAGLLVLPIGVYFLIDIFKKKNIRIFMVPIYSFVAFLLTLIPVMIFELRHRFLNTHNLISVFTKQNIVSSGSLLSRMYEINTAFVGFVFHIACPPLLALVITTFVLSASLFFLKRKPNSFIFLNVLTVIFYLFGFSRVNSMLIPHYYNAIYLSFYLLIAYILTINKNFFVTASVYFLMAVFIFWQATGFDFLGGRGSFQDVVPRRIGAFIAKDAGNNIVNLTTYPTEFTSRDCFQYFIELNGGKVVDGASTQVTDHMYVLCDKEPCRILRSDSWNIQMFGKAKIDTMWKMDGVSIYKLSHK